MIGLQFFAETHHMEYKSIAEYLGISKQTIQDWLKGRRKIPAQRLEQLCQLFGTEDKALFQKELLDSEKVEIQLRFFQQQDGSSANGSQNEAVVAFLQEKSEETQLMESVGKMISTEGKDKEERKQMIKNLVSLIEQGSESDKTLMNLVLYFLADYKHDETWGVRPQFKDYDDQGVFAVLEELHKKL